MTDIPTPMFLASLPPNARKLIEGWYDALSRCKDGDWPEPPEEPEEEDPNLTPHERCVMRCFRAHVRRMERCADSDDPKACYLLSNIALENCLESCDAVTEYEEQADQNRLS